MEWSIFVAIGLLLALLWLQLRQSNAPELLYEKRRWLATPAEKAFLQVLMRASDGRAAIVCKARVSDVLEPQKSLTGKHQRSATAEAANHHFDFVLLHPETCDVLAGITLEDAAQASDEQKARSGLLEQACASAAMPLYRFQIAAEYDMHEIRQTLFSQGLAALDATPNAASEGQTVA